MTETTLSKGYEFYNYFNLSAPMKWYYLIMKDVGGDRVNLLVCDEESKDTIVSELNDDFSNYGTHRGITVEEVEPKPEWIEKLKSEAMGYIDYYTKMLKWAEENRS